MDQAKRMELLDWIWHLETDWNYKAGPHPNNPNAKYESFGNFNFGATAAARGLSLTDTLYGAGAAQLFADVGRGEFNLQRNKSTFFDNPSDVSSVASGWWWASQHPTPPVSAGGTPGGGGGKPW